MKKKVAVILFNLGGPNNLKQVRPFLFRLFYDPAILTMPNPFRLCLATTIAVFRTPKAKKLYQYMGGKSPILENTISQAQALESACNNDKSHAIKVFPCMRYNHPMLKEVLKELKTFQPYQVILLPLYPHYSTTTTESFLKQWDQIAKKTFPNVYHINNYATDPYFIKAHQEVIRPYLEKAHSKNYPVQIVFSAHSLPQKIIDKGDPYQKQVEQSVEHIMQAFPKTDYALCYQSKVGPLPWLKPSTKDTLIQAAKNQKAVVMVPISFVSEHVETLVELDVEYADLAKEIKLPFYGRVPTLSTHPLFIECLKQQIMQVLQ